MSKFCERITWWCSLVEEIEGVFSVVVVLKTETCGGRNMDWKSLVTVAAFAVDAVAALTGVHVWMVSMEEEMVVVRMKMVMAGGYWRLSEECRGCCRLVFFRERITDWKRERERRIERSCGDEEMSWWGSLADDQDGWRWRFELLHRFAICCTCDFPSVFPFFFFYNLPLFIG